MVKILIALHPHCDAYVAIAQDDIFEMISSKRPLTANPGLPSAVVFKACQA